MDRWTGFLTLSLNPNSGGAFFKVAASLLVSPSSKTPAVPSANAIFFYGDRVEGTGNPVIERLSDSRYVAELLVAKLGGSANAWVVEASTFNGPFAVYREFIPTVNSRGEPKRYDPSGFPASSTTATILGKSIEQVRSLISTNSAEKPVTNMRLPAFSSPSPPPKTIILGFSKGGTVVNQLVTELAHLRSDSDGDFITTGKPSNGCLNKNKDFICPNSKDSLLLSISEFHYVDVGLNCAGAYLTDHSVVKKIAEHLCHTTARIHFAFHGTPRQWCDSHRPWIHKEKDILQQLLKDEGHKCEGRLLVSERFYFANQAPSMQMHFEIIETMDVS